MNTDKLVKVLANKIASLQKKADCHYYLADDQEASSHLLDKVDVLKEICGELNIVTQVYEEAYKIYDFRNSGKIDFEPDLELLRG